MSYVAPWSPSNQYLAGETVSYGGYDWVVNAGKTSTIGTPPPLPALVWTQISPVAGGTQLTANTNPSTAGNITISPASGTGVVTVGLNTALTGLASVAASGTVSGGTLTDGVATLFNGSYTVGNAGAIQVGSSAVGGGGFNLINNTQIVGNSRLTGGAGDITLTIANATGNISSAGTVSGNRIQDGGGAYMLNGDFSTTSGNANIGGTVYAGTFDDSVGGTLSAGVLTVNDVETTVLNAGGRIQTTSTSTSTPALQVAGYSLFGAGTAASTAAGAITAASLSLSGSIAAANLVATTNDIWVSPSGNDTTGTGSITNPYATINKAITVANAITASATPVNINILSGNYTSTIVTSITRPNVFLVGYGQPLITQSLTVNVNNTSFNGGGINNIVFSGSSATISLSGAGILNYSLLDCTIYSIATSTGLRGVFSLQNCNTYTNTPSSTVLSVGSPTSALTVSLVDCDFTVSATTNVITFTSSSAILTVLIQNCFIVNTTSTSYQPIILFTTGSAATNARITSSTLQFTNTTGTSSTKLAISWSGSTSITDTLAITNSSLICEGSTATPYTVSPQVYLCLSSTFSGAGVLTLSAQNVSCGVASTSATNGATAVKFPLQSAKLVKSLLASPTAPRFSQYVLASNTALGAGNTTLAGGFSTIQLQVYPDFPADILLTYNLCFYEASAASKTINAQLAYQLGSTGTITAIPSTFPLQVLSNTSSPPLNYYTPSGTFLYQLTPSIFASLTSGTAGAITFYIIIWVSVGSANTTTVQSGSSLTISYNNAQSTYS